MRQLLTELVANVFFWVALVAGAFSLVASSIEGFRPAVLADVAVLWTFALLLWAARSGLQDPSTKRRVRLLAIPLFGMWALYYWLH